MHASGSTCSQAAGAVQSSGEPLAGSAHGARVGLGEAGPEVPPAVGAAVWGPPDTAPAATPEGRLLGEDKVGDPKTVTHRDATPNRRVTMTLDHAAAGLDRQSRNGHAG